jgi:hypothetical protein
MIRTLSIAAALALIAVPSIAAPFCATPRAGAMVQLGSGIRSETEKAEFYERRLRAAGVNASNTRMWNECIQTFVYEDGKTTQRLYDPFTLEEIQLD